MKLGKKFKNLEREQRKCQNKKREKKLINELQDNTSKEK